MRSVKIKEEKKPSKHFGFETFGGFHADASTLLKHLQWLLDQAVSAFGDVDYAVRVLEEIRPCVRVSFVINAAVGRQLARRLIVLTLGLGQCFALGGLWNFTFFNEELGVGVLLLLWVVIGIPFFVK